MFPRAGRGSASEPRAGCLGCVPSIFNSPKAWWGRLVMAPISSLADKLAQIAWTVLKGGMHCGEFVETR